MNNKYIKSQVDKDDSINDWDIIKVGTIFYKNYQHSSIDLVRSYLNAAKNIYSSFRKENHPRNGVALFLDNQLSIPFLFLCRHTIELAIKVVLDSKKIHYENIHNLKTLFSKSNLLENLDLDFISLIESLDMIDDKGMWLRYDKDLKTKDEYINKVFFMNATEIMSATEKLTKFLIDIAKSK